MSSRGGVRPTGTDGGDYAFREQVASRYHISAQAKICVRFSIFMHFMLSAFVVIQLATHHLEKLDIFPKPQLWEYYWIVSLLPAICGYLSLNRNRLFLLNLYNIGCIAFGLLPVLVTMLFSASELLNYVRNRETTGLYNGFPEIVLWYIFLFIAVQVHGFGIYYAHILRSTWKLERSKKK